MGARSSGHRSDRVLEEAQNLPEAKLTQTSTGLTWRLSGDTPLDRLMGVNPQNTVATKDWILLQPLPIIGRRYAGARTEAEQVA